MMMTTKKEEVQNDGCVPTSSRRRRMRHRQLCILCGPTYNIKRCRFPKLENIREEWIRFCERISSDRKFSYRKSARLCIIHFNEDCVRRDEAGNIVGVVPEALPTMYSPDQIRTLKNLTEAPKPHTSTMAVRYAFKRIMPEVTENGRTEIYQQNTTALSNEGLQTMAVISEGSIIESRILDKQPAVRELQAEENSSDVDVLMNAIPLMSSLHSNSVAKESSRPGDCVGTPSTPSSSHSRSNKARCRSVRHIRGIRVTDLESPRSHESCVAVMHHDSQAMMNRIRALRKKNLQLKNEVRNLKEALEKFRKDNSVERTS